MRGQKTKIDSYGDSKEGTYPVIAHGKNSSKSAGSRTENFTNGSGSALNDSRRDDALRELSNILRGIQLSEDQIDVYLACIKMGARPASVIAKAAGLKRSKTYEKLQELSDLGLVQSIEKNGIKHFSVLGTESIERLISSSIERLSQVDTTLKGILPILAQYTGQRSGRLKVEFWRGDDALCAFFERVLKHPGSTIYGFFDYEKRWPEGRPQRIMRWEKYFTQARASLGIEMHVLCNRSKGSDEAFQARKTARRYMKVIENISIPLAILIHDDTLTITVNGEGVYGVTICDSMLVESALQLFKTIWGILPDYSVS